MFAFAVVVELSAPDGLSADDVTEIIEAVVEDLDHTCVEAEVSSNGVGQRVRLDIQVLVDDPDELSALAHAATAVQAALHAAEVATAAFFKATGLSHQMANLSSPV